MAPTDDPGERRSRAPRPQHLPIPDPLLSTSSEDLGTSPGTQLSAPPYRARPSASSTSLNELLVNSPYNEYPPSPAYRSRINMHDDDETREMQGARDEKHRDDAQDDQPAKPKVHYHDANKERAASPVYLNDPPPVPNQPTLPAITPFTVPRPGYAASPGSGPPSTIGTDEDDDGVEESDYDWSGEEDLVGEETKMEEKFGVKAKKKGWSFKRIITLLFSSLIGSTFLAAVLVAPAILIHFYWYKPNPTEYRLRVKKNVQAWLFWAAANLLVSWYLALIIDLVPTVALSLLSLFWGHISERVKSRVELYHSVKNTIKPAFYAASGWVSWVIIFSDIFHLYNGDDAVASQEHYTERVYQVMEFLFFFVLVFCAQKMLSHAIAFQFHRTAFKERLDELGTALKAIETLRDYRPKWDPNHRPAWKARSTGWRTPLFGTTPVIEKDHFDWSGTATSKGKHSKETTMVNPHSRESTMGSKGWDEGAEADTEGESSTRPSRKNTLERELDAKGKKRASGSSWAVLSGRRQATNDDTAATSSNRESKSYTPPKLNLPSRGSPVQEESPKSGTPTGHTPILDHRYPPSVPGHDHLRPFSPAGRSDYGSPRPGYTEDATETLAAAAKALKTAVLHDARNIKGKEETNDILGIGWIGNSTDAKRLARTIFYKFRPPHAHRKYLLPSDFAPAFHSSRSPTPGDQPGSGFDDVSPETAAAFRVFDKDNNGDVSRAEIKTTLIRVYRERRALARSMRDINHALDSLDKILGFFAVAIIFFISLQVFGVNIESSLSSVYTLAIAASFIFKNAASNAFDAIMFLFVTHPFDTGDRVFIGTENLIVKKMGIFSTVFTRVDGTETYFFNSQLFNMFLTNIRRSGKQFENCALQISWKTPLEKIDALEECLNQWLSTEENRWYEPATSIMLQNIEYQRYLEITIGIAHNGNWQDWGLRNARKTAFHAAVNYYCRQLGISGHAAPLPVVWGDDESGTYVPPSPSMSGSPYLPSESRDDISIVVEGGSEADLDDDNKLGGPRATLNPPASPLARTPSSPSLGFKAPEGMAAQLRARKSKGRKAIMRGMDG
ncbi:hypothetical protein V5O48_007190 [Marasmius crinis-equi]|uniref:EF-hand domain-containing protein n=1 Tax=Marasmius crinis-equi TaxID=585013 RepID=A0ABR3FHE3_9AGAR